MDFFDTFYSLLNKAPNWDAFDSGPNGYSQSVKEVQLFFSNYIAPPLRSYISEVLQPALYNKYNLPLSTDPLSITNQFLDIDTQKNILRSVFKYKENDPKGIPDQLTPNEGFELYKKYWNANRALRNKTPNFPPRDTTGTGDFTDPLVFGRRNLNLFSSYGTFPGETDPKGLALRINVTPTPNQVNNQTEKDTIIRQQIKNNQVITTTFVKPKVVGVTTSTSIPLSINP